MVSGPDWLFDTLPQGLEFALLGMTLWVVSRHWRTDLVEARRRLRLWFVGLNGSYIFLLILSREILFPGAGWLATWTRYWYSSCVRTWPSGPPGERWA